MKNLFFLLVFLFTTVSHSQSIVFEPVGDMDKPMPFIELKIKDQKSDKEFEWQKKEDELPLHIFFIDETTFSTVLKNIEFNNTKIDFKTQGWRFGAYRIIYTDANGKQTLDFILPSQKESYIFFKEILPLASSHHYLHEEIEVLIRRLNY